MSNTNTTQEPPRFKHDCDACKYLGRFQNALAEYDLYICEAGGFQTFLARWSNQPSEYLSGDVSSTMFPIAEAQRRAIAAGLLPAEPSAMITIAEVAAKLGLEKKVTGNWSDGRLVIYPSGRGYDVEADEMISARQVCELAGVDYDRYEGRELEPQQAPERDRWLIGYDAGLEAGRAESAQIVAALLEAAKEARRRLDLIEDAAELSSPRMKRLRAAIAQAEAAKEAA